MPAEARVTKIWKQQKLFISLFLIAFGLWFFIDGKWVWPRSNERWELHAHMEKEGRLSQWPAEAKKRGWKPEPPKKYHDKDDILVQFIFASLCGLGGAVALFYWISQKGRVVRTDAEAVYSPAGTRVPFEAITGLGLKKWDSKGLATVRYEIAGRKGQFVLDDYKFDRDPTHAIFNEIKERIDTRAKPAA
jgi:hypothetical protein